MSQNRSRLRAASAALVAVALVTSASAALSRAPAGAERDEPSVEGSETLLDLIPAADFRSNNWLQSWDGMLFEREYGYLTAADDDYGGCASAAAALPHGATVLSMTAWAVDNDAGADFTITLKRRSSIGAGPAETMASTTTSGASSGLVPLMDLSVTSPEVDIDGFDYFVETCTWSNVGLHRLHAVAIHYSR